MSRQWSETTEGGFSTRKPSNLQDSRFLYNSIGKRKAPPLEESARSTYDEIECEYQSESSREWKSNSSEFRGQRVNNSNSRAQVQVDPYYIRSASPVSREKRQSPMRSTGTGMDTSGSMDQSVSTWFPIPALHTYQSSQSSPRSNNIRNDPRSVDTASSMKMPSSSVQSIPSDEEFFEGKRHKIASPKPWLKNIRIPSKKNSPTERPPLPTTPKTTGSEGRFTKSSIASDGSTTLFSDEYIQSPKSVDTGIVEPYISGSVSSATLGSRNRSPPNNRFFGLRSSSSLESGGGKYRNLFVSNSTSKPSPKNANVQQSNSNDDDDVNNDNDNDDKSSKQTQFDRYMYPFGSSPISNRSPMNNTQQTKSADSNDFGSTLTSEAMSQDQKESQYKNPFSSSSSSNRSSPINNNNVQRIQSNEGNSLKQSPSGNYVNPFGSRSSSNPSPINNTQQTQSDDEKNTVTHTHTNPFDSSSSLNTSPPQNEEDMSKSRSRSLSRSAERQRIVRPTPDLITDDSKFHTLLSCATSPDDPKWFEALQLLAAAPNPRHLAQIKIAHAHNWTALHIAALSNPPLFLVYGLLLVYPEGVRDLDSGGRLPLHLAAGSEGSVSALSILVRFYSESVIVKEDKGLIPLHLALLRDGNGELSTEILRILLGQNISGTRERLKKNSTYKVRDGYMRNGNHLNIPLSDVKCGMFGESPNAIFMRELKQREKRMQDFTTKANVSRGFTRIQINDGDSFEGIPHKYEYLASLWEEENISHVDTYSMDELRETEKFPMEVQHCLKKLAKWKTNYDGKIIEKDDDAISDKGQYKNIQDIVPAAIPAPPHMRLPIHMAVRRNHQVARQIQEEGPSESLNRKNSKQNDILRILIHAYPSSLMYRDAQGRTPIMTCLSLSNHSAMHPVDLEMVELLLGVRTAGFRAAPQWLEDNDIVEAQQQFVQSQHNDCNDRNSIGFDAYNPAMIPCSQTLPLHLAALESLPTSIVHAIYSCYPGAKYVQDERNCTPLHCLLQEVTGSDQLDLDIVSLLIDERVARMRDILNKNVLDLLVENSRKGRIPAIHKHSLESSYGNGKHILHQFRSVFQTAMLDSISTSTTSHISNDDFLKDLRDLPSWMRSLACGSTAVQKILLMKLSSSLSTAIISLYCISLFTLTICFICLVDGISNEASTLPSGYFIAVYSSWTYLVIIGLSYASMAFHLNIGWNQCIINIWSWITTIGLVTTLLSTVQFPRNSLNGSMITEDHKVLGMSTVTIAFLWAMVIGYLSRWCYGINVICSGVLQMIKRLVCSLVVFVIFTLAFMQMIYVTQKRSIGFDQQCIISENESDGEICTIWDSYKITYFLVLGDAFFGSNNVSSNDLGLLMILFTTFAFVLFLHFVAISISSAKRRRENDLIVESFWVPILTHVLWVERLRYTFCCGQKTEKEEGGDRFYEKARFNNTSGCCNLRTSSALESRLGNTWDYICASFSKIDYKNTKWWYLQRDLGASHLLTNKWFVRSVSIFLVPCWICLGFVSLGVLWPPQFRWWLFTWSFHLERHDSKGHNLENYEDKTIFKDSNKSLRLDMSRMKNMIYERFHYVQCELHDIKNVVESRAT